MIYKIELNDEEVELLNGDFDNREKGMEVILNQIEEQKNKSI